MEKLTSKKLSSDKSLNSSDYSKSKDSSSELAIKNDAKHKLIDIDEVTEDEDDDSSFFDVASADIFSLANNGKTKTLQTALDMGIDPNSTDRNGNTILI